jgi:HSP20 family protein
MASTNMQQRPAEVVRWDPFEDLEQLQQQLAQVFPSWPRTPPWPRGAGPDAEFAPLADVEETDDAYVIEIELAGVRKEDVNIELSGHRLAVTGERKEKERKGTLRRRTRTVGRFRYEIMLPGDIDDKKVEAHLDDGVLTVRVPKPNAERPKQITIK